MAASGGTRYGTGRGHGGARKGASKAPRSIQTAPEFSSENQPASNAKSWRTLSKEEKLDAIREANWNDAFNKKLLPRDRFAARKDLQDRLEGTPIQRSVDLAAPLDGMTDAELAAIVEHIQRQLADDDGAGAGGTGQASG